MVNKWLSLFGKKSSLSGDVFIDAQEAVRFAQSFQTYEEGENCIIGLLQSKNPITVLNAGAALLRWNDNGKGFGIDFGSEKAPNELWFAVLCGLFEQSLKDRSEEIYSRFDEETKASIAKKIGKALKNRKLIKKRNRLAGLSANGQLQRNQ